MITFSELFMILIFCLMLGWSIWIQRIPSPQRFNIENPYFDYIKRGIKRKEGRPSTARMVKSTKEGDIVEIYQGNDSFLVRIGKHHYHNSIEEMLQTHGVENMLPDLKDEPNAMVEGIKKYKKYRQIAGLNDGDGETVAIEMTVLNPKCLLNDFDNMYSFI